MCNSRQIDCDSGRASPPMIPALKEAVSDLETAATCTTPTSPPVSPHGVLDPPFQRNSQDIDSGGGGAGVMHTSVDAKTRSLQRQLLALNQEKQLMESEFTRLMSRGPLKSGEERRNKLVRALLS